MTVSRYWAGTLHSVEPGNGHLYVRKQMVFASDYDALRAEAEALRTRLAETERELDDQIKWASHYSARAGRLEDALMHLHQAYANKHSPQHRDAALNSAWGVLNSKADSANDTCSHGKPLNKDCYACEAGDSADAAPSRVVTAFCDHGIAPGYRCKACDETL